MARVNTNNLSVEQVASDAESSNIVGGGGFSIRIGGFGFNSGHHGHHRHHGHGGWGVPAHTWHNTSHYHFNPGGYQRHGNHFHYVPPHLQLHRTGHWHHNHH